MLLQLRELDGALFNYRRVLRIHEMHLEPGDPAFAYSLSDIVFTLEQQEKDWARDEIERNTEAFLQCRTRAERLALGKRLQVRAIDLMEKRRGLREEISRKKRQALEICASREDLPELAIIRRRLMRLSLRLSLGCGLLHVLLLSLHSFESKREWVVLGAQILVIIATCLAIYVFLSVHQGDSRR